MAVPTQVRSLPRALALPAGLVLALAGFVLLVLRYDTYRDPGYTMDPAVKVGQWTLVDTNDSGSVHRGDIVLFDRSAWPGEASTRSLLRVAGVAGDAVTCCDSQGRILVNGSVPGPRSASGESAAEAHFSVKVAPGRVFLLGDRRDLARDSRSFLAANGGTVPTSAIKGRAVATILPLGSVKRLDSGSAYFYGMASFLVGVLLLLLGGVPLLRRWLPRLVRRGAGPGARSRTTARA